ncbi:DUF4253 domain-containing protein [Streptomyces poriticola]|uniref:DUF4253 domain-containing protein n=1 Tax=Streptomyces poriticola TaxID=3120506 RepID=UPI002FCDFCA6
MDTLPDMLSRLLTDPSGRAPGHALPAGRLIDQTYQGTWPRPLFWLADAPAAPGEWTAHHAERRSAGLRPVLMDTGGHRGGPEGWDLMCGEISYPEDLDAEEFLAHFWRSVGPGSTDAGDPDDPPAGARTAGLPDEPADPDEVFAPFGAEWPGLAGPGRPVSDPDARAAELAEALTGSGSRLEEPHLALVPAHRSADIPVAIGWSGSLNHEDDAGVLSAVLRSWEDRFAARLVALTADRLVLSVAAPPATRAAAEAVAAEHLAFCPQNLTRGRHATLRSYAAHEVLSHRTWDFRWD